MDDRALFCSLDTDGVARLISQAQSAVCYAAPGIRLPVARAMLECAGRLGSELITVCLDFDERVIRMGYGDFTAVELLRDTGVASEKQQSWGYLGVKSGSFYTTFGLLTPFLCFFTTYLLGWAIPTRFI